jgi:hypothetical protein
MLTLILSLKHSQNPAHQALDRLLLQKLASPGQEVKALADQLLIDCKPLIQSGLLKNELLTISIHKVKSLEWNTLMVRYLEPPYRYQAEVKKEKPQTTLF